MTNFLLSLTSSTSTIPAITYPSSACLHRTEPRPSCEILQTLTMVKRAGGIRDSAKWYEMGGKCAWSPSNKMRSRSSDTLERDRTREKSDRRAETIVARRPNAKNPGLFRCPRTQPYNRSSVINQTSLPVIAKRPQTNCDRTLSLSLSLVIRNYRTVIEWNLDENARIRFLDSEEEARLCFLKALWRLFCDVAGEF